MNRQRLQELMEQEEQRERARQQRPDYNKGEQPTVTEEESLNEEFDPFAADEEEDAVPFEEYTVPKDEQGNQPECRGPMPFSQFLYEISSENPGIPLSASLIITSLIMMPVRMGTAKFDFWSRNRLIGSCGMFASLLGTGFYHEVYLPNKRMIEQNRREKLLREQSANDPEEMKE